MCVFFVHVWVRMSFSRKLGSVTFYNLNQKKLMSEFWEKLVTIKKTSKQTNGQRDERNSTGEIIGAIWWIDRFKKVKSRKHFEMNIDNLPFLKFKKIVLKIKIKLFDNLTAHYINESKLFYSGKLTFRIVCVQYCKKYSYLIKAPSNCGNK